MSICLQFDKGVGIIYLVEVDVFLTKFTVSIMIITIIRRENQKFYRLKLMVNGGENG